jgi:hypothetical protein
MGPQGIRKSMQRNTTTEVRSEPACNVAEWLVSHWFFVAESRLQSHGSAFGVCGRQMALKWGFLQVFRISPAIHSIDVPYSSIIIIVASREWHCRPIWVLCAGGFSVWRGCHYHPIIDLWEFQNNVKLRRVDKNGRIRKAVGELSLQRLHYRLDRVVFQFAYLFSKGADRVWSLPSFLSSMCAGVFPPGF